MNKKSGAISPLAFAVMGAAAVVLGLFYRLPVQSYLSLEGMAYFQAAFPIYLVQFFLCTYGLTPYISRLVMAKCARHEYKAAQDIFFMALISVAAVGLLLSVSFFLLAAPLANFIGLDAAAGALQFASPLLAIMLCASVLRGYLEGMQILMPSNIARIAAEASKWIGGLILCSMWSKIDLASGAKGAILGITIGEAVALLVLIGLYTISYGTIKEKIDEGEESSGALSVLILLPKLLSNALPALFALGLYPIFSRIDGIMAAKRLMGAATSDLISQYSLFTAFAMPLALGASTLIFALLYKFNSAVLSARFKKNFEKMRNLTASALRINYLFSLPIASAMCFMGGSIAGAIFSASLGEAEIAAISPAMIILGIGLFFLITGQICASSLLASGNSVVPLINTAFALIIKLTVILIIGIMSKITITSLAFSTTCGLVAYGIMNYVYTIRSFNISAMFNLEIIKPLLASLIAFSISFVVHKWILLALLGNTYSCLISVAAGIAIYITICIVLKAASIEDFEAIKR